MGKDWHLCVYHFEVIFSLHIAYSLNCLELFNLNLDSLTKDLVEAFFNTLQIKV